MNNAPTPPPSTALPCVSTGLKATKPAARPTFSEELRHLANQFTDRPATLAAILAATQGRGFNLLLVLICLPFLTPIPLLVLSTPFGLVVFMIGARLALGRRPWLPRRLLERELSRGFITKLLTRPQVEPARWTHRFSIGLPLVAGIDPTTTLSHGYYRRKSWLRELFD